MSPHQLPLFILPIHHSSQEKYSAEYRKWVKKKWMEIENKKGKPFDELDDKTKDYCEERWMWPSWKFNDIIGYLDIWMEINNEGNLLFAYIFLKRKYFHKGDRKHLYGHYESLLKNHEFFYYRKINKIEIKNVKKNNSYIKALNKILDETQKVLKQRNRSFQLWQTPHTINSFNFVKVYKQFLSKEKKHNG